MKGPKVYSRWHPAPKVYAPIGEGSADQSFAAEADIGNIMRKYEKTGVLVDPLHRATRHAAWENWAQAPESFLELQNSVLEASRAFDGLPSRVRAKFQGSVPALLAFLADPGNREEAIHLGLIDKPAPPDQPAPPPKAD